MIVRSLAAVLSAERREVAIIMDTSTSMLSMDRPRYAVQVSKILSALTNDGDGFSVPRLVEVRRAAPENCSSLADGSLESRRPGESPYVQAIHRPVISLHALRRAVSGRQRWYDLDRIAPVHGSVVWRQRMDGEWEAVPADRDTPARPGALFKIDSGTVYFELRFKLSKWLTVCRLPDCRRFS